MNKYKLNIIENKVDLFYKKMLAKHRCINIANDEKRRLMRVLEALVGVYDDLEIDEIHDETTFRFLEKINITL